MNEWLASLGAAGKVTGWDSEIMAGWKPVKDSPPLIVYGRMEGEFDPAKCPQAKLTSTTVCGGCGGGIKAGDSILPSLAVPPAEGTWRHDGCPARTQEGATR